MEDWQADRVGKRLARNFRVGKGECVPFYVACLGIDRCYGGREEGGWWYDTTTVLKVYKVYDWKSALVRCRELKEDYPTCPRGRYSVIGGQDTYVRTFRSLEDLPEEDYGRPRYE